MHINFFVEKDDSGEFLCTWVYPKLEIGLKTVILRKCQALVNDEAGAFSLTYFGHYEANWYYIAGSSHVSRSVLPQARMLFIAVWKEFVSLFSA